MPIKVNDSITEHTIDNPQPEMASSPAMAPAPEGVSASPSAVSGAAAPAYRTTTDPNKIIVTIADRTTPIVVLYGPPSCGKTMTLVRLARYLQEHGYQVVPDKSFRDSQDAAYQELCDNFNNLITSNDAANSTSIISFMLVKVLSPTGHPVCQLLEAPGEHYFDPDSKTVAYPPYITKILNSANRKIWAVMLEPDWKDQAIRSKYVSNIKYLYNRSNRKAKVLFLYNKVDLSNSKTLSDTVKEVQDHFVGIFEPFRNQNPITKFWRSYNCNILRFTTGDYAPALDGSITYTPSSDEYPARLWKELKKMIRG